MAWQRRLERQLVAAVAMTKPRVPEAGRLLWKWFLDLSGSRTSGMMPNPISFLEIEAYARLHRLPILPWHVQVLRAMDQALLASVTNRETTARADGVEKLPPVSTQQISPQLFDVMFG